MANTGDQTGIKLPATKPYRVKIVGATYYEPAEAINANGEPYVAQQYKVGGFGEEIMLTEQQARRLLDLDAVLPSAEPLTYAEMDESQLADLAKERGVEVRSTSADQDQPLKDDYINALNAFDQGQGKAL